jgi:glycosyltransferase involved in cell wall biosynthesis
MNYKNFVIVIPSYNNAKWAEKNLLSACSQNYPEDKFKIIYTDDCSTDGTPNLVQEFIDKYHINNISLIRNTERKGALHNLYDMIHSCEDTEIAVNLDADDVLSGSHVLNRLNKEYQNENCWLTYGSYLDDDGSGNKTRGCCKPYEQHIINSRSFRKYPWRVSHCRTYYSKLFKLIKKEDLMYEGKMMDTTWDLAKMFPMLELCGDNFFYIDDILYIYNTQNPISDFRIKQERQAMLDRFIRNKPTYNKLEKLF